MNRYRASTFRAAHPLAWRAYLAACGPLSAAAGLAPGHARRLPRLPPDGLRKKATPALGAGLQGGALAVVPSSRGAAAAAAASPVVVVGPVSLANLRLPPAAGQPWPSPAVAHAAALQPSEAAPNVMHDGFVLRPVEERAFLADWCYEVFTPVSLTNLSGAKGSAQNVRAVAQAQVWFEAELAALRAALRGLHSEIDQVGDGGDGDSESQWSQSQVEGRGGAW
jgi:hypothetical protein